MYNKVDTNPLLYVVHACFQFFLCVFNFVCGLVLKLILVSYEHLPYFKSLKILYCIFFLQIFNTFDIYI